MTKILRIALLLVFISTSILNAQGIQFEEGNWSSVVEKAKKENKMIYLDAYAEWCGPCKMMAKNIFPTKEAGDKYNSAFINYKVDAEKGEGIQIAKKYGVTAYPTNLYIDPKDESVVYKSLGAPDLKGFLERADDALKEFNDPMTLEVYEKEFKKGGYSQEFLENYIAKANIKDADTDPLLNVYLEKFGSPVSDGLLKYLVKNTKTFDNNVVAFLYQNKNKINDIFKEEGPDYFSAWTQQLPYNTFQKAVTTKNENLIVLLYNSMQKFEFSNNILGANAFKEMFYKQLGDEEKAAKAKMAVVDRLMKLSNKDLETQNTIELQSIKKAIEAQVKQQGLPEEKIKEIIENTLAEHPEYALSANFTAAQKLNEVAWQIYEDEKADKKEVQKAISWAKKASDLTNVLPSWAMFADTHAHLLYKSGKKTEAIKLQEMAVKKAKENNVKGHEEMQSDLDKMKTNSL